MNSELERNLPTEILERRAEEQRERIADSVFELKESLRETVREKLDIGSLARPRVWKLASVASIIAMSLGYTVAGMFTRH